MKKLILEHLDDLAIGSAILGSGGGGDTSYPYLMARHEIEKYSSVSLISMSELKPDDLIIPIGFMGAPLAEMEKIPSGREFFALFEVLQKSLGKKIDAIVPFEIGGGNAFTPLMVAAQQGLPVLDADTMGRAFPEVQMSSCHLAGVFPSPGFVTDCLGNTVAIHARNTQTLEKLSRQTTVTMGSTGAFAIYPLTGAQARSSLLDKSVSKAISIGKAHRKAKQEGKDPLSAVLSLCKGTCLGSGKITDIDRVISRGFVKGTVTIQHKNEKLELAFQNEFLAAKCNGKIVATTPDILTLLEHDTGSPILSETLQFGLKVNLIVLPAPHVWTTPAGLSLVGPRHFGYEVDYHPFLKNRSYNLSEASI